MTRLPPALALLSLLVSQPAFSADESLDPARIEAEGAVVGEIVLQKSNVFDLSNPEENNWLYRLANKLHIVTRDSVIQKQLLLKPGERFSMKLSDESERILRQNSYLYDADIRPTRVEDGVVDLAISTRDVWTLGPDISASRKGGENTTRIGIEELNFLGLGQSIRLFHEDGVERRSNSIEFFDRHLGNRWMTAFAHLADNSDGHRRQLSLSRPFYALDTRRTYGLSLLDDQRRNIFYSLGEQSAEYQSLHDYVSLWGGWSGGLQNGWVKRYTAGVVFDDKRFTAAPDPALPALIPSNRKLVYPFVSFELLQDRYETAANRDQIGRTEDFHTGTRFTATLGWSDQAFDADRDALLWSSTFTRGFGDLDKQFLMFSASASGRLESGKAANSRSSISARYYKVQTDKRLFFATLSATSGDALDLDALVELGGETGLRGYPLSYQTGDSSVLLSVEQRFFTDWYPFRLVRVGGAIFADAGRVWGRNPAGGRRYGWLTDVGFGLRLGRTRSSSGKLIHLDLAFPLGGDATIDDVQILLESKRSF